VAAVAGSRNPGHALRPGAALAGHCWRRHPRLRSRSLIGGLAFASVSVLFSTMALLLSGPPRPE
jgi:hypothetical protein